jgi:hypothetical protein
VFHTEKSKVSSFGKEDSSDTEGDLSVRGVRDQGMDQITHLRQQRLPTILGNSNSSTSRAPL